MEACSGSFVNIRGRYLARTSRVLIVTAVLAVAGMMYFNRFTILPAISSVNEWTSDGSIVLHRGGGRDVGLLPVPGDSVFRRLDTLLTTIDSDARATCPHLYGAGGRCFWCSDAGRNTSERRPVSSVDGRKPVCLDLLPVGCSVLSFGINHDFSFEEVMQDLGCTVHAFDPTMGVESFHKSDRIFFNNLGIGSTDTDLGGFPVSSLGSIVRHRADLQTGVIHYLKLDVESSEWEVLHEQLTSRGDLLRVHQLNIEFHLFQWSPIIAEGEGMKQPDKSDITHENAVRFLAVIEALKSAGFGLVSSDPNLTCQPFDRVCLSFIYDTHWVNKNVNSSRVV